MNVPCRAVSLLSVALLLTSATAAQRRVSRAVAPKHSALKRSVPQRSAPRVLPRQLTAVAFSPDGKYVAVCGSDGVQLFEAGSGNATPVRRLSGGKRCSAFAYRPDGHSLAMVNGDAGRPNAIVLTNATGAAAQTLDGPQDAIYSLAYSPNGRQLAAACYDHTVTLWDLGQGKDKHVGALLAAPHAASQSKIQSSKRLNTARPVVDRTPNTQHPTPEHPASSSLLKDHADSVYAVAFSPDGRLLASASGDRAVKVWDTQSHKRLYTLSDSTAELYAVAFRPDGKQVVAGGADKTLRVWNVSKDGGSLARSTIAHEGAILRIAYSHDGKWLYTSSEDKTVKQWDADTLQERRVFPQQADWPQGLALSPDDRTLAVACHDGALTLYDTATGKTARSLLRGTPMAGIFGRFSQGLKIPVSVAFRQASCKRDTPAYRHSHPQDACPSLRVDARPQVIRTVVFNSRPTASAGRLPENPIDTEIPQTPEAASGQQRLALPCVVSGKLTSSRMSGESAAHTFRFHAESGQKLCLEVVARRMGSRLDSELEVLDAQGRPIERAILRAVAQTELTLAERDSAIGAMRLLTFNELNINDLLLVGREVVRIVAMPKGPDDDTQFRSFRGQRLAYFGTTPEYHSVGATIYKVEAYPPGTVLASNGLPVTRLTYRNDDGGPLYGKDSYLEFTPPASADYLVRLTDARGQSGDDYKYRLLIHSPRPDFKVNLSPAQLNIPQNGAIPLDVECERTDGFDGPVDLKLEGLPPGFTATSTTIEAGETNAFLLLTAGKDVPTPAAPYAIRLIATAQSNGKRMTHVVEPGDMRRITVLPPSNVTVTTDRRELTLHPGEDATLTLTVTRQKNFTRRVPIDARNLPFGVRVQNIGLNGILVPENETTRQIVLHCDPWVTPQTREFLVQAQVEGGVANAAPPILLRIEPKTR